MLKNIFQATLIVTILTTSSYALKTELVSSNTLHGGITHARYTSPDFPLVVHVITVPVSIANLQLQRAQGQREEVSSIAKRTGAFIAINGCNYRRGGRYNGNRLNLLYHNKKIYNDLQLVRGSLAWNNTTKSLLITSISLHITLSIAGISLPINSINQPRSLGQATLYNDVADIQLLQHAPGLNVIIDTNMTVVDVSRTTPHCIPSGWHVYQTDNDLVAIQSGAKVELYYHLNSPTTKIGDCYDFVLGGAGLLIQDGTIVSSELYSELNQGGPVVHCHDEIAADFSTKQMQEWLIELRHPRTAVGVTDTGKLCMVAVDGRQTNSEGLSLHELAQLMQILGCINAINLGGGGCTTLSINGAVVNTPSANEERPVSEALCLYTSATA